MQWHHVHFSHCMYYFCQPVSKLAPPAVYLEWLNHRQIQVPVPAVLLTVSLIPRHQGTSLTPLPHL